MPKARRKRTPTTYSLDELATCGTPLETTLGICLPTESSDFKPISGRDPGPWRGIHFKHGYLIVRINVSGLRTPQSREELEVVAEGVIHPMRVLWSWDMAKAEAERLNALNGPKGDYYYVVGVKVEEAPPGTEA